MDFIDTYLDYSLVNPTSELFHKWSALTAISAALERRVWLNTPGRGMLCPNIYTVLVGAPGSGKTVAIKQAESFMKKIQYRDDEKKIFFSPVKLTPAALIEEFVLAYRAYHIDGEFVPQCPMFAAIHELSDFLTDIGGGAVIPELLTYWDSPGKLGAENYKVRKKTRKASNETLTNPSLVVLAGTTDEYLSMSIGRSESQLGVTARIIFVVDNEFREDPLEERAGDPELEQMLIYRLTQIYRLRGTMRMSPSAKKAWEDCIRKNNKSRLAVHNKRSIMEQYFNRKLTQLQKVSMLCSVSRSGSLTIEAGDIKRAQAYLEELEATIPVATGIKSIHKDPQLQEIFLRYIPYEFETTGEILKRIRSLDGSSLNWDYNADAAMDYLIRLGAVERKVNGEVIRYRRVK